MRFPNVLIAFFSCLFTSPSFLLASDISFPASEKGLQTLWVGEKVVYNVSYLKVSIGKVEGEVLGLETIRHRKAYHVVVRVRSSPVIDLICKVRGEHHTWMDQKDLSSLRYEKYSWRNPLKPSMTLEFDPEKNQVVYQGSKKASQKIFATDARSQDQISMGYFFRTLDLKENQSIQIPVHANEKKWKIEIKTLGKKNIRIKNIGKFQALEVEPIIHFVETIAKPKRVRSWVSLDPRRIPLRMTVKVPFLSHVQVELAEYRAGREP